MPLDGFTAKLLSFELNKDLAGARIDRIFQPDSYDINFRLRNDNRNYSLIASANPSTARFHLTRETTDNPMVPLRFCTVLRKYLSGGRILSIDTPGYERIFRIAVQTMNEIGDKDVKTLIVEIMGRYSNLILLNESGRIIDAALHVDEKTSRVREVLPTRIYTPPPSQNKKSPEEVLESLSNHTFIPFIQTPNTKKLPVTIMESPSGSLPDSPAFSDSTRDSCSGELLDPSLELQQFLLDHITGISPLFVQEICSQSDLPPKISVDTLNERQYIRLESVLSDQINAVLSLRYTPTLFYQSMDAYAPSDFHAFPLHIFPYKKSVKSISIAMDEYYSRKAKNNYLSQKKAYLVKLVTQKQSLIARKIIIHNNDLEECKSKEMNRKFGDLVLSNLAHLRQGQSELTVIDYYEENAPELTIPLQSNLSGSKNAQKYYKRYNKLKSKFESVSKMLEEEKKQLDYFQSIQVSLANVDSNADITAIRDELYEWDAHFNKNSDSKKAVSGSKKKTIKKAPSISFRRFQSSDGYEILVGRNNLQNDQLTTKFAKKEDLWFHIQKVPGTHVIIRTNKETPPMTTIEEAAMLAAWYSKSSDAAINTKTTIDYCPVKNVWKPKNGTPGLVLYRDYSSILVKTAVPEKVKEIV